MGKLIRLLLGMTALLIIVVVITVVGAVVFFDPNQHKDFIISKVEKQTGRSFTLSGDIKLTYYPWLGIEAAGVTLGNAEGFGDQPFFHADVVALRIKTMPLLNKQYELDTLRLHGVQINLAKDKKGISNWADLTGEQPSELKEEKPREPLTIAAVILGGVDIKNTQLTWNDQTTGQKIEITDLNMSTGELSYGAPIDLKLSLKAASNKPEIKSDLNMKGTLTYDLESEQYSFKPIDLIAKLTGKNIPGGSTDMTLKAAMEINLDEETFRLSDLKLDILGTSIEGELTANHIKSGKPQSKTQLNIKSKDLAKLVMLVDPQAAKELTRLDDRSVDMKINLESDIQQDMVKLSNMDVKVLGATIKGRVEANNISSKKPSAKGMLKAEGPDLPALMQVIGQFETGEDAKLKSLGQRLSNVKDKSFDVGAEFDINLEQGNILIPKFSVKTLGINAHGQLDGKQMNSSNPKVDGKFSLTGEKLGGLLTALGNKELGNVLKNITVEAGVSSAGGGIAFSPLQVKATFAGKQIPKSPADVTLNVDSRIDLEKQTLAMKNMTLKGLGLDIAGNINASKIMAGKPIVKGNLDARGSDMALLFKLAGTETLARQLASLGDRSFSIKAKLDADIEKGKVKISDLSAQLVGASIKGHIETSNIQTNTPAVKGSLQASGPDLPTLIQIAGKLSGSDSGLKGIGQKLGKVPNKSFDIATEFDVDFKKGDIDLPILDIKTLGLTAKGQMKAKDMNTENGNIDGKLSVKGEKLSTLLTAFGQADLGEVMQSFSVDAGLKGNQKDIALSPFDVKATFAGKQIPNSPVTIKLNAKTAQASLEKQSFSVSQLALTGLGLAMNVNVRASKIFDKPKFNGDLNIAEFNLRDFAKQLNQELPKTADKKVFQKVGIKTAFSGSHDSISFNDLTMRLDNTQLNGNLAVNHFTQPDIQFNIGIDSINADRYLPPASKTKKKDKKRAKKPGAAGKDGSSSPDLPVEMLRTLKIKGDLFIGQLVLSNITMKKIKMGLRAKDGDIHLDPSTADLYQGKYQGAIGLDVRGKMPKLDINTSLQGVQIEPLLKDYEQKPESQLAGVANISAHLTAAGKNPDKLKRALNGNVELRVNDGILRGIDVRKTLEAAEVLLESKRPGQVKQGGETRFQKLTATMNIKNGVVTNKDLLILAPGFRVNGEGMLANFHDNTIKYNLAVAVDESSATRGEERFNIGGYKVPIKCRGSLDAISTACQPDYAELAKIALEKSILDKIEDSIGIKLPGSGSTSKGTSQPAPTQDQQTTQSQETQQQQQKSQAPDPVKQIEDSIDLIKGIFD